MYEKLVFTFPQENNEVVADGDDPGYVIKPQAYFRGASQIPGSEFNVGFQIFVKPFFLDRVPHRHAHDEYLVFLGGSFPNVFDFDADIEFTLGQLGVDAEVFHITKPTIIRVPAGVYHCPLNFKRVDKPIFFQAALMEGMFGGNLRHRRRRKAYEVQRPRTVQIQREQKMRFLRQMPRGGLESLSVYTAFV